MSNFTFIDGGIVGLYVLVVVAIGVIVRITGFGINPLRKAGVMTIPELFEKKFGPRVRRNAGHFSGLSENIRSRRFRSARRTLYMGSYYISCSGNSNDSWLTTETKGYRRKG